MNKLINPNGGMPLELDDLIFIQDSFKDALKGVLHEFTRAEFGNVILSGCEVTNLGGGNYSISSGYVMLGYEVCFVPATTENFVISALVLGVNYDPAGNDIFFDGVARDTYEIRTAKPYDPNTSLPSLFLVIQDSKRLTNIMPNIMKDNWALTDFIGEKYIFQPSDFKNGASANVSYPPYAIKKNGVVRFYGQVDIPALSPSTDVLAIPTAFRKGISSSGGQGDVYICSYGNSLVRFGAGSTHLRYLDTTVAGSNNGYGVSLNQISYDIDNI